MPRQVDPFVVRPGAASPRGTDRAELPASKSHAQRALLLGAWSGGEARVCGAGSSRDVELCVGAVRAVGARVVERDGAFHLDGRARLGTVAGRGADPTIEPHANPITVHCGENATLTRSLAGIAACLRLHLRLEGEPGLCRRPMQVVCEPLRRYGARVSAAPGDRLPLQIDARDTDPSDGTWVVDVETTTQFASGVLLGEALRALRAPRPGGPATLRVEGSRDRLGYLWMTDAVLRRAVGESRLTHHGDTWEITPAAGLTTQAGSTMRAQPWEYHVPRDASAWTFAAVFEAMRTGQAPRRPADAMADHAAHPDWAAADAIAELLADRGGDGTVDRAFDGLESCPDTFPALAALAATRPGRTRLSGAPALRAKECDRIAAMAQVLTAAGAAVTELPDGLVVEGIAAQADAARSTVGGSAASGAPCAAPTADDHRIVMAAGLLGAWLPGGLAGQHARAVDKSWPGYWDWLSARADVRLE